MAKKQETKKKVEVPVVETPVVETPKPKKVEPKKPTWEIKDRVYYLKGNKKPLSYMIKSAGIYWFDQEKQYERELKYCENQITTFVDEMQGDQRLSHIIFRNGALFVPKNKTVLQKLLSIYHPHKDRIARIDVSPSEDNLQSANGNIGDGDVVGISINSSIRMCMINLPNLLVTSALSVRDSEIEDPFLGIDRRFARFGRGRLTLGFRHDLPRWNMNYGLEWSNRFDSNEKVYDIDDIADYIGEPNTNAFVQFVDSRGTTYRFDARNATSNLQCRERTRFVGRISANILEEIEDRCETSGRVVSLKINGTF